MWLSYAIVYGVLLGRQKGRSVEVCNSYELVVEVIEGHLVLDKEYFTAKEDQCKYGCHDNKRDLSCDILFFILVKQVFSDMEFIGWYMNGEVPTSEDATLHEQVR